MLPRTSTVTRPRFGCHLSRRPCATLAAVALTASLLLAGCGGDEAPPDPRAVEIDGPEHVHGLGVNPRDGTLMIASHSGLFRLARGEDAPRRVGDLRQDTMGFTVVGPDRFLGSGHPDLRTGDPPHLGLIASDDGGRTWTPRSLRGAADLHIIAARPAVVYAVDALSGRLLASPDEGRRWTARRSPGDVVALAVDPSLETRVAASTTEALFVSTDGAATWRRPRGPGPGPGLLAWPAAETLLHLSPDGALSVSTDRGATWRPRGALQAEPAAFSADGEDLHVADAAGRIFASVDGGRTWRLRAEP